MHTWKVFYEEADGDDEKRYLGTLNANTGGEALNLASQYYEMPSHDLVVEQQDKQVLFNPPINDRS